MNPRTSVFTALGMEDVGNIDPMLQMGLEEENKAYSATIERAVALQQLYIKMSSEGMSQRLYASMEALDVDLSRFRYSTESIDSNVSTKIGLETLHDVLMHVLAMLRRHLGKIIAVVIAIAFAFIRKSSSGRQDKKEIDSNKLCEETAIMVNADLHAPLIKLDHIDFFSSHSHKENTSPTERIDPIESFKRNKEKLQKIEERKNEEAKATAEKVRLEKLKELRELKAREAKEKKEKETAASVKAKLIELFNKEELSILEEELLSGVHAPNAIENTFVNIMVSMREVINELHEVMGSIESIEAVDSDPSDDHTSRKVHDILKALESKTHAHGVTRLLSAYSYSNLKANWGLDILPLSAFWTKENRLHSVTVKDAKFKYGLFWEALEGHTFSPVANNLFTYKKLIKQSAGTIKLNNLNFHNRHWNTTSVQGPLDEIKKQREVLDRRLANLEKALSAKSPNRLRNSKSGYCWPQVKPYGEKVSDGYVSTSTIMSGILINSTLVIGFHRIINQLSLCMADTVRAGAVSTAMGQKLLTFSDHIVKELD